MCASACFLACFSACGIQLVPNNGGCPCTPKLPERQRDTRLHFKSKHPKFLEIFPHLPLYHACVFVTHARQPQHAYAIVNDRKLPVKVELCAASLVCLFPLLAIHGHLALVLLKGKSSQELSWRLCKSHAQSCHVLQSQVLLMCNA